MLIRATTTACRGGLTSQQVVPGTPSMEEAQAWAAAANQQACNLGPHTAGGAAPAGAAAGAAGAGDLSGAAFGIEAGAVTARRLAPKAGGRGRARHAAPALSPATLQVLMGALPVPSAGKQQVGTRGLGKGSEQPPWSIMLPTLSMCRQASINIAQGARIGACGNVEGRQQTQCPVP